MDEIIARESVNLGALQAEGPAAVVERASAIATALADIIDKRRLFSVVGGRRYVRLEGWTTLGAMLGVLPREVETHAIDNGYESTVELIRVSDGAVIGCGSAICTRDETNWSDRPDYAVRSMAITRAAGKSFRLAFSWIVTLAGYEPTPAEEMDAVRQDTARQDTAGLLGRINSGSSYAVKSTGTGQRKQVQLDEQTRG